MRDAFGAHTEGHRDAIRAHLAETLTVAGRAVRDLSAPPELAEWSTSISHTFGLGGWVAVPRPRQIGFDLEVAERVRETVVKRMCTPTEIEIAPSFAVLWSAKEALFKAMARGQPATLSQLRITAWTGDGALTRFTSDGGAGGVAQTAGTFAAAWCVI